MKNQLTQKRLKELLDYIPESGEFVWKLNRGPRILAGSLAGYLDNKKYRVIKVDNVQFKAHRLAFLWMNGEFPPQDVDHINRNPSDNRWLNLRHATRSQNCINKLPSNRNSSGHVGVYWSKQHKKWRAQCKVGQKQHSLGLFENIQDAFSKVSKFKRKIFGQYVPH